MMVSGLSVVRKSFKFHYPERGRKRVVFSKHISEVSCSNSITPKGDGNIVNLAIFAIAMPFKFHYPKRGRKLARANARGCKRSFKFHYPERGRKLSVGVVNINICHCVQIPLPRKGTETITKLDGGPTDAGSNSITPKGDGNFFTATASFFCSSRCSNSITPKGDGNTLDRGCRLQNLDRSNSITPKGDGNFRQPQQTY